MNDDIRNPLVVPDAAPSEGHRRSCPTCGSKEFRGRNIGGSVIFTCSAKGCGERWGGSIAVTPQDPRTPLPPERYVPPVRFERRKGDRIVEVDRTVDTRPEFKKGAPIPDPEGEK